MAKLKPKKTAKPENEYDGKSLYKSSAKFVGQDMLAGILGITPRRIRQLAAQGLLTKAGRGHYPWPRAAAQYCDYLRNNSEGTADKLKTRELELKCQKLEQTITERDREQHDTIERDCWEQVQDFLAEYQTRITRLKLTNQQLEDLNEALSEAIENVRTRHTDKATK